MRLITSGCSFTRYCWPTWADYLGQHYEQSYNVGIPGADNATIARHVLEFALPGDLVIVLWSSYDRFSYIKDGTWQYNGSIRNTNKEFFTNMYDPVERFSTTIDYVRLLELHSQQNNYTLWHFSAYPWFLGEIEKSINPELITIHNKVTLKNHNLEENLFDFYHEMGVKYTNNRGLKNDDHPTPLHHWCYLEKIIAPTIGLDLNKDMLKQVMLDENIVLSGKA